MSKVITTSDLNSYMNKTLVTAVAADVVNAINSWIENHTNRCWGDSVTVVERYDWKPIIYLRHQDVTAVISVKTGWPGQTQFTVASGSYYFNKLGRLTFFSYGFGFGNIFGTNAFNPSRRYNDWLEISYTYGVATVPDDLKLAALGIASGFYNWATTGQKEVVATSVGSYRLEFIGAVRGASGTGVKPNLAGNTSEANWSIIDSYRTRRQ